MKRSELLFTLICLFVAMPISAPDTVECEDGFRLMEHEYLATAPVCIPANPQRIIALDEGIMADLVALGVRPVGVHDGDNRDFTRYLDTEDIASAGTPDGPNYEAMLELDPDLIVGRIDDVEGYGEGAQEILQQIAPTVLSSVSNIDWQEYFTFVGAVVDEPEEAERLIGIYDQRITEFQETLENQGQGFTIAIIRSRASSFNVYAADIFFIVRLIEDAGLQFPETFAELPEINEISLEEIDLLSSDYLFVMIRNEDEGEAFQTAVESPLWQFLPAVQNDQVFQVNWSTWVAGWNAIGAQLVVDDLYFYLTDTEPPTPNPFLDILAEDFKPPSEAEAEG